MRTEIVQPAQPDVDWTDAFDRSPEWREIRMGSSTEFRFQHEGGSVCRLFLNRKDGMDHCYIYPPGGTDSPSGPIASAPFLKPKKAKK